MKTMQLIGRVVSQSGDSIAGAQVVALTGHHFQRHPIDVELSEGNGLYKNAEFAKTDAEGRFEIAGSLEQNETLSVSVIAKGYAPLRIPHAWLPEELPLDLGDLAVSQGHSVSGKIVDEAGEPLGDVQVLMALDRGVPGCFQSYPGRGIPLTRTDADGRFTASGLVKGRWLFIFDKSGYRVAQAEGNLLNDPQTDDLAVTLARGGSISGRVIIPVTEVATLRQSGQERNRSGNTPTRSGSGNTLSVSNDNHDSRTLASPAPRLMVEARPLNCDADYCKQFPSRARPRRAVVQADGSFLIEGLNEEEFMPQIAPGTIHGYHPEWTIDSGKLDVWLVVGHAEESNRRLIELPEFQTCRVEAGTKNVELPWLGRANLSACVIDEAGRPVEGFIAEVHYEGSFRRDCDDEKPTVGAAGRIEIRDFPIWDLPLSYWKPAKKSWLVVKAPGFEDQSVEIQDQLCRGEHNDIGNIVLQKGAALCLRVLDTDGQPIRGARVYQLTKRQAGWYMTQVWEREELPQLEAWRVADTDANGEVRMATGNTDVLAVQHPDFGFHTQPIANQDPRQSCDDAQGHPPNPPAIDPIEIQMNRAGRLIGTALEQNGQPAGLRDVFLEAVDSSNESLPVGFRIIERTEIDGTFRFDRLHGRFLIGMLHPEEKWRPKELQLENERTFVDVVDEAEVSLAAWSVHDFTVEIREADRAVIGAKLKLMSEYCCTQDGDYYDTAWQGFTNDRGRYTFRQVAAGDVVMLVKHDDRNMVNRLHFHVGPDMENVHWLLDNNTISGKLVDPDGKPHAWGRIGIKTDIAGYCQRNNDGITYENGRGGLDWFWSNQAVHETWTDADGNFHLRGLVADIPITLYTRHGEVIDTDMKLKPLKPGEHREGIVFTAGYTGKKGWRGSKN